MLPAAKAYNVTDESSGHLRLLHRGPPSLSRLEHSRLCHLSSPWFLRPLAGPFRPSTMASRPRIKIFVQGSFYSSLPTPWPVRAPSDDLGGRPWRRFGPKKLDFESEPPRKESSVLDVAVWASVRTIDFGLMGCRLQPSTLMPPFSVPLGACWPHPATGFTA